MEYGVGLPISIRSALYLHIAGGLVALLIFLVPMLTRKGSAAHILAGKIYLLGMWAAVMGAVIITPWRFFGDPAATDQTRAMAILLFFLSIFAVASMWQGVRAVKTKLRDMPEMSLMNMGVPVVLLISSVGAFAYGFFTERTLLMAFPLLGFFTSLESIKFWRQPTNSRMAWWYEHMKSMFTACIATTTAFLVTALPRFVEMPINSVIIWLLPTFILVPVQVIWTRYYQKKFNDL